jgi:hypothetical protein
VIPQVVILQSRAGNLDPGYSLARVVPFRRSDQRQGAKHRKAAERQKKVPPLSSLLLGGPWRLCVKESRRRAFQFRMAID